jgi:hypothetical protein
MVPAMRFGGGYMEYRSRIRHKGSGRAASAQIGIIPDEVKRSEFGRSVCLLYFTGYRFDSSNLIQLRKRNLALFKRKEPILGIDISPSAVKLIELSRSGPRFRVEAFAIEPLGEGMMEDRNPTDPKIWGKRSSGLAANRVPACAAQPSPCRPPA